MPKLTERSETTDVTNGSFFHVAKSQGGGIFTSFKITIQNLKEALGINTKQDALGFTPENVANKATTMTGNDADDVKYLSAKAIYTWCLSLFVQRNAAITPSTKTKITYSAVGLVLNGEDATTNDVIEVVDKRYLNDLEKSKLQNLPIVNFGNLNTTFSNESSKKITINNLNVKSTSKIIFKVQPSGDLDEMEFYNINSSIGNIIPDTSFEMFISLKNRTNKIFNINYQILN